MNWVVKEGWLICDDIEINSKVYKVYGRYKNGYVWYKIDDKRKMKLRLPDEFKDEWERFWYLGLGEFKKFIEGGKYE